MEVGEFHLLNVFTGANALGNPCAVVRVDRLDNSNTLARIAADLCVPATAFITEPRNKSVNIRWFSPDGEIQFCGHGALGAGQVLLADSDGPIELNANLQSVQISRDNRGTLLKGAAVAARKTDIPPHIQRGFHGQAIAYFVTGDKDIVLLTDANSVANMAPDYEALRESPTFGYAITAPAVDCDFVSRVLRPHLSDPEDTATGSAHLALAPFWAARLKRSAMEARQLSARGGAIACEVCENVVTLIAQCHSYANGRLVL